MNAILRNFHKNKIQSKIQINLIKLAKTFQNIFHTKKQSYFNNFNRNTFFVYIRKK